MAKNMKPYEGWLLVKTNIVHRRTVSYELRDPKDPNAKHMVVYAKEGYIDANGVFHYYKDR